MQDRRRLPYIDLHCDTLTDWIDRGEILGLNHLPDKMCDLDRLYETGVRAQMFAIFFPPPCHQPRPLTDQEIFDTSWQILQEAARRHSRRFALATSPEQIQVNFAQGKVSGILSIEDGRMVQGKLEQLDWLYQKGVRCMALTWNFGDVNIPNCFGAPNSPEFQQVGLTDFGKEAVGYMQQLGMLVDVSHLSDGGFWDVVSHTDRPFIASHSNCRSLCPLLRNLSDPMIRALADRGGVSGVNFCPDLVKLGATQCSAQELAAHVLHFVQVGGEDCVALGTDFDGIGGQVEVDEPGKMHLLFRALRQQGMTPRQLDKFCYGNALRVFQDAMK